MEKEEKEEQEDNDVKRLIQSTTKYLTTEDYNELTHLLQDIENQADPDFINSVAELKKLIDKFIVNEFDSLITLPYYMERLERVQYQAALAVTGCWKTTNRNKLYDELGWESLSDRRRSRRNFHIHKITLYANNY